MSKAEFDFPVELLFRHLIIDAKWGIGLNPFEYQFIERVSAEIMRQVNAGHLVVGGYELDGRERDGGKEIYWHHPMAAITNWGKDDLQFEFVSCLGETVLGARVTGWVSQYSKCAVNRRRAMKLWPRMWWWNRIADSTLGARQRFYWEEHAGNIIPETNPTEYRQEVRFERVREIAG